MAFPSIKSSPNLCNWNWIALIVHSIWDETMVVQIAALETVNSIVPINNRTSLTVYKCWSIKWRATDSSRPTGWRGRRAVSWQSTTWDNVNKSWFCRQPWSSGNGIILVLKRLWILISALDTGWTFFLFICCKFFIICLKRQKINWKEARDGPFLKKNLWVDYQLLFGLQ